MTKKQKKDSTVEREVERRIARKSKHEKTHQYEMSARELKKVLETRRFRRVSSCRMHQNCGRLILTNTCYSCPLGTLESDCMGVSLSQDR